MITRARTIAVVGAGWAGLSAAVRLVDAGHRVTVFDAARDVGGRARAFNWQPPQMPPERLDNGQHIMIGAYREMLELLRHVGCPPETVLRREPLTLIDSRGLHFKAGRLFAPLHLLSGMLFARGLTLADRLAMARLMMRARRAHFRIGADRSVEAWLLEQRQPASLIARVWAPLCVAALNTPMHIASAQIFLNVLRDSLGAERGASDFLLPTTPLDQIVPAHATRYLQSHGATLALGQLVERIDLTDTGVSIRLREEEMRFDGLIAAVAAHRIKALIGHLPGAAWAKLATLCDGFHWQPITTIYLYYDEALALPAAMMALEEKPLEGAFGQWLFARGALGGNPRSVAVVISAEGRHRDVDGAELERMVARQLRNQAGITAHLVAAQTVTEKRATFAAVPGLLRPNNQTPSPHIALAGDYTESDYPATLEGALRSGRIAAGLLVKTLRQGSD
jgi:squalene-associated FAD-dependent desaturase